MQAPLRSVTATVDPRGGAALSYPAARTAAYVVGVLFILTLLSQLDRQLPALLVRPLRQEFGLSDTDFSLLQGYSFAVFYTLAGLPLGRLVDRANRRNLIFFGLLFWSASTGLFALAQTHGQLLLARVGVGVGEAVLAPAAYSMIADLVTPAARGRALAAYYVSLAIGSGASLLLGGWLLGAIPARGLDVPGVGPLAAWRVAFLVAAAPAVPLAILLLTTVREPQRREDGGPSPATPASIREFLCHLRVHAATFSRILTYPTVLSVIGYGALSWAPALFDRRFGMPASRSGVLLGILVAAAGGIGTIASGLLSDRWTARAVPSARLRVALLGLSLFCVPAIVWPLMPNAASAFALLFVTVFGLGIAQAAAPAVIQGAVPNRMRGQAIALYLLLAGLFGIGLGPTAVAIVTDRLFHDDHMLPLSLAVVATPCVILGLWLVASGLKPYEASTTAMRQLAG